MQRGSVVTNLQTELNYLNSFKIYCNSSDLDFLGSWGGGAGGWGYLGWPTIVYMSSGVFRGKESLNRIELSQLIKDIEFWWFGLPVTLRWGWEDGDVGGWECTPHTCTLAHPYMHTCSCVVNMIISCKWQPPLGESLRIPYDVICACTCMHVHVCLGHPPLPPTHHPPWGTPRISKMN